MKRRVLVVVMDGVGVRGTDFGNAVALAQTPYMTFLKRTGAYRELAAHGTAVGLPSDADIGNSEVGHNALGAGQIVDQGAKLVQQCIDSGEVFRQDVWRRLVDRVGTTGTLHFLGLLSDGNVHSHDAHLHAMIRRAKLDGVRRVRIHVLWDGRDVAEPSAEKYLGRLRAVLRDLADDRFSADVASGGGRMRITMDRYEADWEMVRRGWVAHVLGEGPQFLSAEHALADARANGVRGDQFLPEFVVADKSGPIGLIKDGDGVVLFNFRGDRAVEITRAFTDVDFDKFSRPRRPDVLFAGMMSYDGDLNIPRDYLVQPPVIEHTLSAYLVRHGVRQFACAETQKFGHVTYFWNGNRSGVLDPNLESYVEIPSESPELFARHPWMQADAVACATISAMRAGSFDFGRVNFANGDMVGHTGDLEAAVIAVAVVDQCLGRLIAEARRTDTVLVVTADHGNCDEMFDAKEKDYPNWRALSIEDRPRAKTSHTLSPVPLYLWDPRGLSGHWTDLGKSAATLGHIAGTCTTLMGVPPSGDFLPSLWAPS